MRIGSIRLQNFKGIKDESLHLRPLTVLMGPNSAGKSTFIQALVAVAWAHRRRTRFFDLRRPEGVEDPRFWPVDLPAIERLRNRPETSEVSIELSVIHDDGSTGTCRFGFGGAPTIGLELSSLRISSSATFAQVTTGGEHGTGTQATDFKLGPPIIESGAETQTAARETKHQHTPPPLLDIQRTSSGQFWRDQLNGTDGFLLLDGLANILFGHTSGTTSGFNHATTVDLARQFERLAYLGPNRHSPWRRRPHSKEAVDVGPDGAQVADVLSLFGPNTIVAPRPPRNIPTTVAEAIEASRNPQVILDTTTLGQAVNTWMKWLLLTNSVAAKITQDEASLVLTMPMAEVAELPDVGFGVSQALPVVVQSLLMPQNSVLIVEQPEAQLHPRSQAALADLFCSQATNGRNAIVESHSEAFFHRLRLRVALDPQLADKVAVYFIDAPTENGCCRPRAVDLVGSEGIAWPEGFLSDGVTEELALRAVAVARYQAERDGEQT